MLKRINFKARLQDRDRIRRRALKQPSKPPASSSRMAISRG